MAQKILSCVVRVKEGYGADYVAQVLLGSREQRILGNGHDQLSTYGLLKDCRKPDVRQWIEQLSGQGFLESAGEYRTLRLTPAARQVLKGEVIPKLSQRSVAASSSSRPSSRSAVAADFDVALFERLRLLRRELAEARGVPPFVVFGDVTLQDLARRKPATLDEFLEAYGVGQKKCQEYGEIFLNAIRGDGPTGSDATVPVVQEPVADDGEPRPRSPASRAADELFRAGQSVAEVAIALSRAESTVRQYLSEFLIQEGRCDPEPWLSADVFARVDAAARELGDFRLKPLHEHLGGEVPYEDLRIAATCLRNALRETQTQ